MRGNDIKNLELLPQATAGYDAEGGTGVLVINRQKKHEYGLSGYVGSEYERKSKNLFSEFVNQVYKSKVTVQKALEETQILFDSLMQKYFG